MSEKWKPCPFCGGKPYMAQNYLGQKYVRCPECGACVWGKDTEDWRIATMGEKKAEKAAIEAWNRRTERTAKVVCHDLTLRVVGYPQIFTEYLCGACKKKVLSGEDYCSHCGVKLEWG